jgi:hypothetical protein
MMRPARGRDSACEFGWRRGEYGDTAVFMGRESYTIPLTLALIYAPGRREELERTYDGNQILRAGAR